MKDEKLATLLLAHIRKHNIEKQEPVTRASLNFELRKIATGEQLSYVLLNMLQHGYLHKQLTDATVHFWVTAKVEPTLDLSITPDVLRPRDVGPDLMTVEQSDQTEQAPKDLAVQLDQQPALDSRCPLDVYALRRVRTAAARDAAVYDFISQRPTWPASDVESAIHKKMRQVIATRAIDALLATKLISLKLVDGHYCYIPITQSVVTFPRPSEAQKIDEELAQEQANIDGQPAETTPSKPTTEETVAFDIVAFNLLPDSVKQSVNNIVQTLAQEFLAMTTSNGEKFFQFKLTPSLLPVPVPESWANHATLIWGSPSNFPSCPVGWEVAGVSQLTPNMVFWGQRIKAETQAADTQLIKDLHEVLARLKDTPCVKGYPGLDDLLLRSAARIEL